jgi:hypothetical protein
MKIIIFWNDKNSSELLKKVNSSLDELGLESFINIETTNDEKIKEELNIKKEPALIVEEEAIDFKDTIFEWIIPDEEELKWMFISIIWWADSWGCWPSDWWCPTWCSC